MVLSLTDGCSIKIRDSIEQGIIRDISRLPWIWRQRILDLILMHGTLMQENCLRTLSSPEFLTGATSLDVQLGRADDREYLKRVAQSLATITSNGQSIGSGIERLRLNLYLNRRPIMARHDYFLVLINGPYIVRLINQCPRLTSLGLALDWSKKDMDMDDPEYKQLPTISTAPDRSTAILSQRKLWAPCEPIISDLNELILTSDKGTLSKFINYRFMFGHMPNLTRLRLVEDRRMSQADWSKLESVIHNTIEELEIKIDTPGRRLILSQQFPRLKSLKTKELFLTGTSNCLNLQSLHMSLGMCSETDNRYLDILNDISRSGIVDFQIGAHFFTSTNGCRVFVMNNPRFE